MIIVIRCPATGNELTAGVVEDPESFEADETEDRAVRCPHCPDIHRWTKEQARLI
jgi:hypothetical protein